VAALEQQLQSLTARLEGALDERREALETAKMTAEAIGDVERAHEEARLQRDALEERAAQDRLQASQDLSEMQAMLDEAQLEIHRLETERAEMLAVAETSPRPDDSGEAVISNLVDIDAMRSAHEAAMARAKRTERELRKRASHINTNQEMILRHLRAEVVSLSNVFEAAGS